MEFRYPAAVAETNAESLEYLTKNLADKEAGKIAFEMLVNELGNAVDGYPEWHPIITIPPSDDDGRYVGHIDAYKGADHTQTFVKGFVTCPYSSDSADKLVSSVNKVAPGRLYAYRFEHSLYHDMAYPVVVVALDIELEADGTIRSRDALAWCAQKLVKHARDAQVAETWWNIRGELLGSPHGSRSSVLVNQHTGIHMRKILEALNNSGMYGPIKEVSLDMLPAKKRTKISETLLNAALNSRPDTGSCKFEFHLRDETCKAEINDTWGDGTEFSIRVNIGEYDLYTSGSYYPNRKFLETSDPKGKRALAEKFL